MYESHAGGWRCRSCGYDNDLDLPACVYCGEPSHDDSASFDELPLAEEDEDD